MINIADLLARQARTAPNREAVVELATGRRYTYAQLYQTVLQASNAFNEIGIQKGERVGILTMNCVEYLQAFYGLGKIGAIVVPLNWRLVVEELKYIIKDAGITTLIFSEEYIETAEALKGSDTGIKNWIQADGQVGNSNRSFADLLAKASITCSGFEAQNTDHLYIMYSSGTTGRPKGSVHSHESAFWSILSLGNSGDFRQNDRYMNVLPMFHIGALLPCWVNLYKGMTLVLAKSFDPVESWKSIAKEKITNTCFVPVMLMYMKQTYQANYDISTLRWIFSGAAPVPAEMIQAYLDWDIQIVQGYSLTESGGAACLLQWEDAIRKVGSTGKGMFHTDIRVVNMDGQDCQPKEPGEVWVKGKHNMLAYWNNPKATKEAFVGEWLKTGDVAVLDEDGYIYIVDRIKDMIISGAENIYPAELENVLLGMPEIVEAAVIGVKSKWGESPLAIVVSSNKDLTEEAVLSFANPKMASYKKIRGVQFAALLPRNGSGKVLKKELRVKYKDIILK